MSSITIAMHRHGEGDLSEVARQLWQKTPKGRL